LEGFFRPGHFDGVLTIVKKLLLAVVPTKAFFGEKDFQQLALIHRMSVDEALEVEVVGAPTIRETNGLAMSSRNVRLSSGERETALAISQALFFAASQGRSLLPHDLERRANEMLASVGGLKVEYCALVNAVSFEPLHDWPIGKSALLVAAFVGDVRLIDNVIIP
jgi:pantoate--beta-alanine ligase